MRRAVEAPEITVEDALNLQTARSRRFDERGGNYLRPEYPAGPATPPKLGFEAECPGAEVAVGELIDGAAAKIGMSSLIQVDSVPVAESPSKSVTV